MATEAATRPTDAEIAPDGDALDAGDEIDVLDDIAPDDEAASALEDDEDTQPPEPQDSLDGEPDEDRPHDAEGWAAIIAETPTRIAEVPAKFRGQAATLMRDRAVAQAVEEVETELSERLTAVQQDAFHQGRQAAMLELTLEGIEQQAEDDPSILRQLKADNPRLHRVYLQWQLQKEERGPDAAQEAPSFDGTGVTTREWSDLNQKLTQHPDVVQELQTSGPWKRDLRFYRHAAKLVAQAENDANVASRRQAAVQKRKALPKPGASAAPGRSEESVYTMEYLKGLSQKQMDELMEKNPDAVYRTMARGGAAKR